MKRLCFASVILAACLSGFAGQRVQLQNMYERVICVVPMTGAGTYQDPRRPMYAPAPGTALAVDGIVAFSHQVSDDGKFALVEFVARDRAAFKPIFDERDRQEKQFPIEDQRELKVFERGKHKDEDIEKELRKLKKDLDIGKLHVAVP